MVKEAPCTRSNFNNRLRYQCQNQHVISLAKGEWSQWRTYIVQYPRTKDRKPNNSKLLLADNENKTSCNRYYYSISVPSYPILCKLNTIEQLKRMLCTNSVSQDLSLRWVSDGYPKFMTASSNGNIFRVTGPLCGEFTGHRWIPLTKASDAELWYFLWSAP